MLNWCIIIKKDCHLVIQAVTFLGWLSDQPGDEKGTLNHLAHIYIYTAIVFQIPPGK